MSSISTDAKKAPFRNLLYREFIMVSGQMKGILLTLLLVYVCCLMFSLSAVFGNIAKSENDVGILLKGALPSVKLVGVLLSFLFYVAASDVSADVNKKTWMMFRKASAATPFRLALAKYTSMFVAFVISIVLSFAYYEIDSLINPDFSGIAMIGLPFGMGCALVIFTVFNTTIVSLVASVEKAGLISVLIFMGLMLLFAPMLKSKMDTLDGVDPYEMMEKLSVFCTDNMTWLILITILAFIIGTIMLTLIYKRRDK